MDGFKVWAIISVLIYFAVLLFISMRNNKHESKEDFFLAGRKFPHWALALTFVASWFGGSSAIISVDAAYKQGVSAWWILGSPSVLSVIILLFFAKAIRKVGSISQNEIMEKRYNKTAGIIVCIVVIWYMITFASSQMVAIGKFFSGIFDINYVAGIIFASVIVMIYSAVGGFRAVVLTDIIQFGFLAAGLLITVAVVFSQVGWENIQNAVTLQQNEEYFNFFSHFWSNFIYLLSFGLAWVISADAWQRVASTRNVNEAKKMTVGVIFYFIPLYALVTVAGVVAGALYAEMPKGGIVAALIYDYMPTFLGNIVFLGIAAAIMSTMSTAINTGSLYMTDFYNRYINPNASEKLLVRAGIYSTFIISIVGIIISVRIPDALHVLWMSSDILTSAVFIPLLASFVWRRATSEGAVASLIVGSAFVLYNFFIDLGVPLPRFWPSGSERILVGLLLGILSFVIVSYLTKPDKERIDQFMELAKGKKAEMNKAS